MVAAAAPRVPPSLVEQLAPGGRLVHPVGPGGHEQVTAFHKESGRLIADTQLIPARFVPLIGAHGLGRAPTPGRAMTVTVALAGDTYASRSVARTPPGCRRRPWSHRGLRRAG